jgi:hypothetical protein
LKNKKSPIGFIHSRKNQAEKITAPEALTEAGAGSGEI